jgi:hypothetical protein
MSGAPQVAMRNASQIWQIFFPSQTLQVFCFSFAKPSDFLFGPSQKGTICSSGILGIISFQIEIEGIRSLVQILTNLRGRDLQS